MKYQIPKNFSSKIKYEYDLSKSTWFQTKGHCSIYFYANNINDLQFILSNTPEEIPIFVLGVGSNVLIREKGFFGLVIKLGKDFNQLTMNKNTIRAGASVLDITLSKFALNNSIKNFEFYSGIPGTVGGAVKMNAGCYGSETKDIIRSVKIINRYGKEDCINKKDLNFDYRSSSVNDNLILLEAIFDAIPGNQNEIISNSNNIINQREISQPLKSKTGGSTFKNPKGFFAAKLIEESGCKGMKVGDAEVSTKHANFLINKNNASAKDIEFLGEKIREKVLKKFNIFLEWEIKIIGERS